MSKNSNILSKGSKNNFNDIVYTPKEIVAEIIDWVRPYGNVLEPFRGNGAFYDELKIYLKDNMGDLYWDEIELGKDFFKETKSNYNFIITNPPYSIFTEVLKKCFEISENVILLIPHNKIYTSDKRLNMIEEYGTFEYKRFNVPKEWTAKFPIAAYWFKKYEN